MCGALARDGRTLVLAENGPAIDVFDAATGQLKVQMAGAKNRTGAVALSPDGRRAASSDGRDILLWSVQDPRELRRWEQKGQIMALQFSPDGHRLAFTDYPDEEMWILDLDGSSAPLRLEGGAGFMPWLTFSPDGKILAGSCEVPIPNNGIQASLRFWDTATGKMLHDMPGSFEAGAFSRDGRWFAASGLEHVVVYGTATGKEHHRLPIQHQHIWAVAFSPDGKTLATGQDQHIRLWDTDSWQEVKPGPGHSQPIQAVAFAPNGRMIATGGLDGRIIEWSWPGAREIQRIEGVGSFWGVQHLRFSPDGQILAATAWVNNNDPFFLFDACTGRPVARFGKEHPGFGPVAFLPGGNEVITGEANGDGALAVWEAATGKWRRGAGHYRESIQAVEPMPETNRVWWSGQYQGLGLRDLATGQDVRFLSGGLYSDAHLAVSPDGGWLAVGSRVWDLKTGEVIVRGSDSDTPCAISPDGRLLALADDGAVEVWEALTRKKIHRFKLRTGQVRALAFSPDGTVLLTTDYDDALVWDMTGHLQNGRLPPLTLTKTEMESLWQDLGSDAAWMAHRAAWTLAAGGTGSVAFLAGRMHPAVYDPVQIKALRQCLTDTDYHGREHAARELLDLGAELQAGDLEALRRPNPAMDARGIHSGLLSPPVLLPLPGRVRSSRAVMALEHSPASEAQSLLDTLSDGAPAAPQTREAKAALARWRGNKPAGGH